MRPPS